MKNKIRILGIDHNTFDTGVCVIDFSLTEDLFEEIEIINISDYLNIAKKKDIQERAFEFQQSFLCFNTFLSEFNPDYVVFERHNPNGTKSNQMFMFTGILQACLFKYGFSFKNKNLFAITPVEWKMITWLSPRHEMLKSTKKEKEDYCKFFESFFPFLNFQGNCSTDAFDAFGMAYSIGVHLFSLQNKFYFDSLHEEQQRNIANKDFSL